MLLAKLTTEPEWEINFYFGSLLIDAPSKLEALNLVRNEDFCEQLANSAARLRLEDARVRFPGCRQALRIPARMASRSTPKKNQNIDSVFTSQLRLPLPLLKKMIWAAESERPISIVNQRTRQQICVNRPMVELLDTPPEEATQRIMTNFWRPKDLEELERKYKQEKTFYWQYDAALNEKQWAILEARFERFEGGDGDWYSLVTNYYAEPVSMPTDVKLEQVR